MASVSEGDADALVGREGVGSLAYQWVSPIPLSGLVGWYDFANSATLFQDAARTTPVTADGQAILGVTDLSGSGHHLSAVNGPAYKLGILNGHSIGRFDGVNDILNSPTLLGTGEHPLTLFVVTRKNAGAATNGRWVCIGDNADYNLFWLTASDQFAWFRQVVGFGPVGAPSSFHIPVGVIRSPTSGEVYLDGGTATTFDPDPVAVSDGIFLGGTNLGEFLACDQGEVILYDSGLALAQINQVGAYLAAKWGLAWTPVS